jgi:hypothetical protein
MLLNAAIVSAVASGETDRGLYAVGAVVLVFCFVAWRPAVYGVFVLLFIEGYLRNRMNGPGILLAKDAMLAAIYLRVFGQRLMRGQPLIPDTPANVPLAVFTVVVLIQCLNPYVDNIGQALVGARTWLFYIPLYYVALEMLRTERDARRFMWFVLACAVPICALGVYQYHVGPGDYASGGAAFADATFVTGSDEGAIYRPNATFSWPSHFAVFLSDVTLLCLAMVLGSQGRSRVYACVLIGILIGVNLIEGQRSAYLNLVGAGILVLILRKEFSVVPIAVLGTVAVVFVVGQVTDSSGLIRVRELTENRGEVFGSRVEGYWNYFLAAIQSSPVGLGTGATSLGTRYVAGTIPLFVELPLAKVIADLSVVGLVVYLWLLARLCLSSFQAHARAARARASGIASLLAVILVIQLLSINGGYELAIAAIPLWFLSGMAVSLAQLVPASEGPQSTTRWGRMQPAGEVGR